MDCACCSGKGVQWVKTINGIKQVVCEHCEGSGIEGYTVADH